MVVSGRRMNVFVNDATSPTLQVGRLEGDAMKGSLRLQGPGTFANHVITPMQWMVCLRSRSVGIRERETGVCRQEPV